MTTEVKNKNAYEIRADILAMAKSYVESDFQFQLNVWEQTATRDEKTGQIVDVNGKPTYPSLDVIVEAAERLYSFVNNSSKK